MAKTPQERSKKWRDSHPEEAKASAKKSFHKWRSANLELARQRQKKYNKTYRDKQKKLKENENG